MLSLGYGSLMTVSWILAGGAIVWLVWLATWFARPPSRARVPQGAPKFIGPEQPRNLARSAVSLDEPKS